MTQARGVEEGVLLALRWRKRQSRAYFGHMGGSQEVLWHVLSSLAPFFWVVKLIIKNVVAWRSASRLFVANIQQPQFNATYSRCKGVLPDFELV